jgi:hypothetical protein
MKQEDVLKKLVKEITTNFPEKTFKGKMYVGKTDKFAERQKEHEEEYPWNGISTIS